MSPVNLIESIRHGRMYQKWIIRVYDKKVHSREFQDGDLALRRILLIQKDFREALVWIIINFDQDGWQGHAQAGEFRFQSKIRGQGENQQRGTLRPKKTKESKVSIKKEERKGEAKVKIRKGHLETKGDLS
ncbi:RNA-directed DNA polymerase (Reverse transcriptase), Ribonuclease H [Gossypium australe]|uniref:RNA-directed DNA polymerase (Reverse transcriptase), Ribonuclease H n=1 Tax=Gossypium australe TaxID=47621 RepID=A0A5B6WGS2_9ROSI|nr:RNA-directed DNA polymerase (Reverse transcriptase), Ribonuclease H [Gossypium australe]